MLCSYQQMRRDYKIKFTDKLKANLWIHLDLAKVHRGKGLTSPYIVSFLHFLNLDNILNLPKLSSSLKLGLIWHDLCLPCFLPARFTRALVYEIKTNANHPFKEKWFWQFGFQHSLNLRIHWKLIFGNVIRCSALWFWVGYFICFKFTPVFFPWMFLMDVLSFS